MPTPKKLSTSFDFVCSIETRSLMCPLNGDAKALTIRSRETSLFLLLLKVPVKVLVPVSGRSGVPLPGENIHMLLVSVPVGKITYFLISVPLLIEIQISLRRCRLWCSQYWDWSYLWRDNFFIFQYKVHNADFEKQFEVTIFFSHSLVKIFLI